MVALSQIRALVVDKFVFLAEAFQIYLCVD